MGSKPEHRMNFVPSRYAKSNFFQTRDALALINDVAHDLKGRQFDTIVDLGCGPGTLTVELYKRLKPKRMVAFDFSSEMIQTAKEFYGGSKKQNGHSDDVDYSKIEFYQGGASESFESLAKKLNITPGSADLVFSSYCIHWIPPTERSILANNIQQLLKPGGNFYLMKYTWSDVIYMSHEFLTKSTWHDYISERIERDLGLKAIEGNMEQIIGYNPLGSPNEKKDIELWRKLFDAEHLHLDRSQFIRSTFEYTEIEDVINQFNQTIWRTYIEPEKLKQFEIDYRQFLIDNYIKKKIDAEKKEQQVIGKDPNTPNCLLRFHYVYTLFIGRKFQV